MEGNEPAMFLAVEVIRETGTDFLCLVGTQQVWVPLTEIRYGSELCRTGDRGRLIVSRWFAEHIGIRGRRRAARR